MSQALDDIARTIALAEAAEIYGFDRRFIAELGRSDAADAEQERAINALKRPISFPDEKGGGRSCQCPEAYFLENGFYVPNDHTPLQWTQANLRMALHWMGRTAPP